MTQLDVVLLIYLGMFSSGMTFWLTQRATAVLTPGAVTAYSYLVPFVSMLLLFIDQSERIGWHWLPGSLMVVFGNRPFVESGCRQPPVRSTFPTTTAAASLQRMLIYFPARNNVLYLSTNY